METSLGHFELSLNAPDLEAMRTFYAALGFEEVGGNTADGWVEVANGQLRIGLYQGHIRASQLSFFTNDLASVAALLRSQGLHSGAVTDENDGTQSVTLTDPAGNILYFNTIA